MLHSQHHAIGTDGNILLCLQPAPEDTSTELDPKYRISYLSPHEVAEQPSHTSEQEEAVAAAFAFSQLEASLSGVATSASNVEAISRQGMTASTSGTTTTTDHGWLTVTCSHFSPMYSLLPCRRTAAGMSNHMHALQQPLQPLFTCCLMSL